MALVGPDQVQPNLPIAATATSMQGVEGRMAWLTCGQEPMTLQSWVLKAKVLETHAGS